MSNKEELKFKDQEALEPIQRVITEAGEALNDPTRTIDDSPIDEALMGALGMGVGGAMSFAALFYGGSVVGLSAAGITSGLAAAGALVGGGMAAGIAVLAAPIAILGIIGAGIAKDEKERKLKEAKQLLYKEAMAKNTAIIKALKEERRADKKRIEYLTSLNILLQSAIQDLKYDLSLSA